MPSDLTIEDERSLGRALAVALSCAFLAFLCFVILSSLSFLLIFELSDGNAANYYWQEHDIMKFLVEPSYFFVIYAGWWQALCRSLKEFQLVWVLWLPLPVPIISVGMWFYIFSRSPCSFSLWYVLNRHFARLEEVRQMGFLSGKNMVLGWFEKHLLGLPEVGAVLCIGETGNGKTTTVAIPSILRVDDSCVLAVDDSGALARYTSGSRARVGRVFYFNWDLLDDEGKGTIYPRWNPLAPDNVPPKGAAREEYLKFLASFLISVDGVVDKNNYWNWQASSVLTAFIGFLTAKCAQASANDYFLTKIIEKGHLSQDDKDVLLSYYAMMPEQYGAEAIAQVNRGVLNPDNYLPIGSWGGIPVPWQGKAVCFAMLTDWLLKNYLTSKDADNSGDWRGWLEQLLTEAALFNYGGNIIKGLQQFLYLSKQQRQLVFAYVLKPLRVFLNQAVRERTGGNDFKTADIHGIKNFKTGRIEPVTVYAAATTKTTKVVNRMFVEILLQYGALRRRKSGNLPILTVFDDAGQLLKVRGLDESLVKGAKFGTSFLLLCNNLSIMENTYGHETLEKLVAGAGCKIIMADDSVQMSRQLNKLALFATKVVQIPRGERKPRNKKRVSDANYYHRLAKDLIGKKNVQVKTKGYQFLLAEGYYHRPVLTRNKTFWQDEEFKEKATLNAVYFLSPELAAQRNVQDIRIPCVEEVLYDVDLGIDDEIELDQYMNLVYNDVRSKVPDDVKTETVMINDISEKWRKIRPVSQDTGWWLEEDAFSENDASTEENPFDLKK